jgi:hypothetical protein
MNEDKREIKFKKKWRSKTGQWKYDFGLFNYLSYEPEINETAIIIEDIESNKKNYYILDGDLRKEYEKLKSLEECMDFFEKNKEKYYGKQFINFKI